MVTQPSILLLGGGYSLQTLANEIPNKESFIITSRSEQTTNAFQNQGYLSAKVDFQDPDSIVRLLKTYPSIKCLVDSVPPPISNQSDANPVLNENYSEGLKAISSQVEYSIYLSTTGVYGKTNAETVTEETETLPIYSRAKARLIAENFHTSIFKMSSILRLPAIYGPGRGIGNAIRSARYKIIDDGSRITNRIHVLDLALTIQLLIQSFFEHKNPPSILNVADDCPSSQKEVVSFYCKQFNLTYPVVVSLSDAQSQLDPTMLSNQRIDNARLRHFMQSPLRYPTYKEGAATEFLSASE